MIDRESSLEEVKELIREILEEMYNKDDVLFTRNRGKGLAERCLVFRFAHYLQNRLPQYYIDCDYNSSYEAERLPDGRWQYAKRSGKAINNSDGTSTKRFVDVIVHKRLTSQYPSDFICFELKKWNNYDNEEYDKDRNNLIQLTSTYHYKYGFHIILGKTRHKLKWSIFENGEEILSEDNVFLNNANTSSMEL